MKKSILDLLLCAAFTFMSLPKTMAQNQLPSDNSDGGNLPAPSATNDQFKFAPSERTAINSPAAHTGTGIRSRLFRDTTRKPLLPPIGGLLGTYANTSLSNLVHPTAVNAHLLPGLSNMYDLGSAGFSWRSLYLNDAVYINGLRFLHGDVSANTFTGTEAGTFTTGVNNTANGFQALYSNTTGNANVALGYRSLALNTIGEYNIGIGPNALTSNTDGYDNIAIGRGASHFNTSGAMTIAIGSQALHKNLTQSNMAVGHYAMYSNTYGEFNSTFGAGALFFNTEGWFNSAFGYGAMSNNTSSANTGIGTYSLFYNEIGDNNVGLGYNSLTNNTSGSGNTAIGSGSGYHGFNLSMSTFLGNSANATVDNISNSTAVGSNAQVTASNQVRLGNSAVTSIGGYANWTNLSDGRFKKNMKEDVPGLEFITKLRPVTYTLDIDGLENALKIPNTTIARRGAPKGLRAPGSIERTLSQQEIAARQAKALVVHTGFVAQEVEKAAQQLGYNFSGVDAPKNDKDFYGLRYAEFVVPLVKAVQELAEKTNEIDELKKKNIALEERLKRLEELVLKSGGGNPAQVTLSGAQLDQNAPNPFGSSTIINYSIPENEGAGRIVITDMKGSLIKSFNLNGKGRGQLQLNSGTIATGEYIYSLWLGDRMVNSKRMTVLK